MRPQDMNVSKLVIVGFLASWKQVLFLLETSQRCRAIIITALVHFLRSVLVYSSGITGLAEMDAKLGVLQCCGRI